MNRTKAFVRSLIGYSTHDDEKTRKPVEKLAGSIVDAAVKGKPIDQYRDQVGNDAAWVRIAQVCEDAQLAIAPFEMRRAECDAMMASLVTKLPIWEHFESVPGIGETSLAKVIGECGRWPGEFRNVSCLKKRMGVAVIDGKRQGNPGQGATPDDWVRHGYSKERRSTLWNLCDCLMKQRRFGGEYAEVYFNRVAREIEKAHEEGLVVAASVKTRAVDLQEQHGWDVVYLSAKEKASTEHRGWGHVQNRANRYVGQHFLKRLWQQCRKVTRGSVDVRQAA